MSTKHKALTASACNAFYNNLQTLYDQHKYSPNHIWNLDQTCVQVGRQLGIRVLAKRGTNTIYNIIHKF